MVEVFQSGATLNSCNLKTRLQIKKWKQMGLTTSLSKHICQSCNCWEQRAIFSSGNNQSYHERHFCALLSQHSTQVNLIFTWNTGTCRTWVCQFFVNFGLLCTKWEFFILVVSSSTAWKMSALHSCFQLKLLRQGGCHVVLPCHI